MISGTACNSKTEDEFVTFYNFFWAIANESDTKFRDMTDMSGNMTPTHVHTLAIDRAR